MEVQIGSTTDSVHTIHPLSHYPFQAHQPGPQLPALVCLCLRDFCGHQRLFCSEAHDRPEEQRISTLCEKPTTSSWMMELMD